MQLSATADFAADPETVFQMLTNSEYLNELVSESQPLSSEVKVAGNTTEVTRVLAAPPDIQKFTKEITIVETMTWNEPGSDGTRTAELRMTVPKQPVGMTATVTAAPGGRGTTVTLDGELKANIPLIGKQLEKSAAPAILAAFNDHQAVGDRWLAR